MFSIVYVVVYSPVASLFFLAYYSTKRYWRWGSSSLCVHCVGEERSPNLCCHSIGSCVTWVGTVLGFFWTGIGCRCCWGVGFRRSSASESPLDGSSDASAARAADGSCFMAIRLPAASAACCLSESSISCSLSCITWISCWNSSRILMTCSPINSCIPCIFCVNNS